MASRVTRDHHRWTRNLTAPTGTTIELTPASYVGAALIIDGTGATSPILSLNGQGQGSYASPILDFNSQRGADTYS